MFSCRYFQRARTQSMILFNYKWEDEYPNRWDIYTEGTRRIFELNFDTKLRKYSTEHENFCVTFSWWNASLEFPFHFVNWIRQNSFRHIVVVPVAFWTVRNCYRSFWLRDINRIIYVYIVEQHWKKSVTKCSIKWSSLIYFFSAIFIRG